MEPSVCQKCGMEVPGHLAVLGQPDDEGYVCALCEPPKGSKGRQGPGSIALKLFLIVACVVPGYFLQRCSYQRVAELRQIARVPRTKVAAAVQGEVNLSGKAIRAEPGGGYVQATDTKTPCLYFLYTKERQERDSDGDTKWVTVDRREDFVPFDLDDGTGRLRVEPAGVVDFNVPESHQRRSGDLRFTEYRIDPGDRVFTFGFLEDDGDAPPVLGFLREGDYQPIISERTELTERRSRALGSIWLCWGGLCLFGLASAIVFSLFGLHRMLVFFGLLSLVIGGVLFYLGLRMMVEDLTISQRRVVRQEGVVRELIRNDLREHGGTWSGTWETLGNLSDYAAVPGKVRTRLRRVRIDQASAARRVRAQATSFPYNLVRPMVGGELPSEIPLPERDEEFLAKIDSQFEAAKVSGLGGMAGSVIGVLVGAGSLWFGFRSVGRKRLVENLPTSPTSGVTYGLTEVKGLLDTPEDDPEALEAPLSGEPCVAYKYRIQEKRGSGKKAKWVTIHSDERRRTFRCLDREGEILVDPEGAEIDAWRTRKRREGRRKHEESRLQLGDPVYIMGLAQMDEEKGDRLHLARAAGEGDGEGGEPFLISGYEENYVLRKGGAKGAVILTITFGAILFSGLMFFGTMGAFNPASYLSAALVGPILMGIIVIVLHYNDLIFLRERCRRNRSNIDVALRKRHDLIPQLQRVAAETMAHEKGVQERLAALRAADAEEDLSRKLSAGHAAVGRLWALGEDYPEIRSGGAMGMLARQLVVCENEIAFISEGYNDAVEIYNTRISSFPDVLLARMGRFQRAALLGEGAGRLDTIFMEVP